MPKLQNLVLPEELKIPCRHYWIIDPPDGDTSLGYCKHCGKVKEFTNSITRFIYFERYSSQEISNQYDPTMETIDDEEVR